MLLQRLTDGARIVTRISSSEAPSAPGCQFRFRVTRRPDTEARLVAAAGDVACVRQPRFCTPGFAHRLSSHASTTRPDFDRPRLVLSDVRAVAPMGSTKRRYGRSTFRAVPGVPAGCQRRGEACMQRLLLAFAPIYQAIGQ
jgi:hypothetical protein